MALGTTKNYADGLGLRPGCEPQAGVYTWVRPVCHPAHASPTDREMIREIIKCFVGLWLHSASIII